MLAMTKAAEPWSLTSQRERLIKIGAKVVTHGRYVTFGGCGVAADVRRHPVADRPAAGTACAGIMSAGSGAPGHEGEVCPGTSKAGRFSVGPPSIAGFHQLLPPRRRFPLAQAIHRRGPGLETAEYLANVG
jgi:hypothetical protein